MLNSFEEGDSIEFKVTQEHIDRGSRDNLYYDPLALALKEALKSLGITGAMVGWGYVNTYHENHIVAYWYITPGPQIISWLKAWDRGKKVPPTTFKLVFDRLQDRTPKAPGKVKVRKSKTYAQTVGQERLELK